MRGYMEIRDTSPTWGPPPPCKQVLTTYKVSRAPCTFCEESLGKINANERFRAFTERVGLRILSLERVDYFGPSEYFSGRKLRGRVL